MLEWCFEYIATVRQVGHFSGHYWVNFSFLFFVKIQWEFPLSYATHRAMWTQNRKFRKGRNFHFFSSSLLFFLLLLPSSETEEGIYFRTFHNNWKSTTVEFSITCECFSMKRGTFPSTAHIAFSLVLELTFPLSFAFLSFIGFVARCVFSSWRKQTLFPACEKMFRSCRMTRFLLLPFTLYFVVKRRFTILRISMLCAHASSHWPFSTSCRAFH